MPSESKSTLNPPTKSYEFLGPPGALCVTLGVPLITYLLYFGCSEHSGGCPPRHLPLEALQRHTLSALSSRQWWANLWDTHAALLYLAWYAFCVISWAVLPGDWVEGVVLRTGGRKKYKINGTPIFC
jgi:delta14-sterol reductase